jgi:hypothetical protein
MISRMRRVVSANMKISPAAFERKTTRDMEGGGAAGAAQN